MSSGLTVRRKLYFSLEYKNDFRSGYGTISHKFRSVHKAASRRGEDLVVFAMQGVVF